MACVNLEALYLWLGFMGVMFVIVTLVLWWAKEFRCSR